MAQHFLSFELGIETNRVLKKATNIFTIAASVTLLGFRAEKGLARELS